jgi:3-oxoacyl-[acyl-carrier protein] reductase
MSKLSRFSRSIAGSVAIITGAASGMGRATAALFADEGARLGLLDIDADALRRVGGEIRDAGGDCVDHGVDCADRRALTTAIEAVGNHYGRIDILINNAGLALPTPLEDPQFDLHWQRSQDILVNAQQWAVRAALPWLRRAPHPRIVNVASTEALGATNYNSPYVVAKHASLGLTRALAVELGKEGITVNAICPGPVHTGITAAIPAGDKETYAKRRTALRRYGEPEEIAHVTLGIVLPAAGFLTGAAIPVDGGLTIRNA